jgi:hypothetical protein
LIVEEATIDDNRWVEGKGRKEGEEGREGGWGWVRVDVPEGEGRKAKRPAPPA